MDLKTLLLHSISAGRLLKCHKRVHLGKKCYAIEYEVKGKYLTVKGVKQVYTKSALRERLLRRRRVWHRSLLRQNSEVKAKPELAHSEIQTMRTELQCHATETETEKQRSVCRGQQTIHKHYRKQGTQTDWSKCSQGAQTYSGMKTRCSQTEWYLSSMSTQTQMKFCNNQVQTEICENSEGMRIEQEAVILLLNEIGEMIINQNHLLHNNSTLLGQISEMMMLTKMASRQNSANKYYKRLERKRTSRRRIRFCGNYPGICLCKRRCRQYSKRSKAAQTIAQFTQTSTSTQTVRGMRKRNMCCRFC